MFAEDIEWLSKLAYTDDEVKSDVVQRELVTILIEGIIHGKVRAHLVRHPPASLKATVKAAQEEEQLLDRVHMYNICTKYTTQSKHTSRYEEPMECDEIIKFQYTNTRGTNW